MGDQPLTRTEFDGLNTAAKALLDQMVALTAKIDNINNHNYNHKNNQNRRCGPIRVRGRNNQVIEDSNFSKVEKTDFEEITSNHLKKLHILREHANSAKSIEKDQKALTAKLDEDEVKPEGENLRQHGGLSANIEAPVIEEKILLESDSDIGEEIHPSGVELNVFDGVTDKPITGEAPNTSLKDSNASDIINKKISNPKELLNVLNSTVIREDMGFTLEKASTDVLGSAAKVVITKNSTLVGADGSLREAIENRVNQIKNLIENTIIQQSSSIYIFPSIPSLSLKQPDLRSPPPMPKKPPDRHVLGLFWLSPSKMREIQILKHVSGIVKPSRMTLLLCPPGYEKKTMLLALAGKLDHDLRAFGKINYCGHELNEFVAANSGVNFNFAVDADSNSVVLLKLVCYEVPSNLQCLSEVNFKPFSSNHLIALPPKPPDVVHTSSLNLPFSFTTKGKIGDALAPMIARGMMLGTNQHVILHMLDIEPALEALKVVKMELIDVDVVAAGYIEEADHVINEADFHNSTDLLSMETTQNESSAHQTENDVIGCRLQNNGNHVGVDLHREASDCVLAEVDDKRKEQEHFKRTDKENLILNDHCLASVPLMESSNKDHTTTVLPDCASGLINASGILEKEELSYKLLSNMDEEAIQEAPPIIKETPVDTEKINSLMAEVNSLKKPPDRSSVLARLKLQSLITYVEKNELRPMSNPPHRPPAKPPHHSRHIGLKELHVDGVQFRTGFEENKEEREGSIQQARSKKEKATAEQTAPSNQYAIARTKSHYTIPPDQPPRQ